MYIGDNIIIHHLLLGIQLLFKKCIVRKSGQCKKIKKTFLHKVGHDIIQLIF